MMSRPRASDSFLRLLVLVVVLSGSLRAGAADVAVRLTTMGQGYQTLTAGGGLLDRRRVSQWMDLEAEDLLGADGFRLEASFRLDVDLAGFDGSLHRRDEAELLTGRLQSGRLFGLLDLSLGRQIHLSELDFLFLDGLVAGLNFPLGLRLELLGGFQVQETSWLANDWLEVEQEPGPQLVPVIGAVLSFANPAVAGELCYRRTMEWAPGWPLLDELAGARLHLALWRERILLEGGGVYALALDRFDRLRADARLRLLEGEHQIGIDGGYLHSRPRFSLDSIFAFFSPAPFDEGHLGVEWRYRRLLWLRLAWLARVFSELEDNAPGTETIGTASHGLTFDGELFLPRRGRLILQAGFEQGAVGSRLLLAPRVRFPLFDQTLVLDGRLLVSHFADKAQARQWATTLGASAAVTWHLGSAQALVLLLEANGNRFQPLQSRVMLVVDLAFQVPAAGVFR